eukprot:403372512
MSHGPIQTKKENGENQGPDSNDHSEIKSKKVNQTNQSGKCEGFIGSFDQAAEFQKDKWIKRGYRVNFQNKRSLIKTFFMLHNETVNIWTHAIGMTTFLFIIVHTYLTYAPPGLHLRFSGQDIDQNSTNLKSQQGQQYLDSWVTNPETHLNSYKSQIAERLDSVSQTLDLAEYLKESPVDIHKDIKVDHELHQYFKEEIDKEHLYTKQFSMLEVVEQYLLSTIHVISSPQSYVKYDNFYKIEMFRCWKSLQSFVAYSQSLHNKVDNEIQPLLSQINQHDDDYWANLMTPKISYLSELTSQIKNRITIWSQDLANLADDQKFDWLELKPIISQPDVLLQQVPRCK